MMAIRKPTETNGDELDGNDVLEEDEMGEEDDDEVFDKSFEIPSTFTNMEETNMTTDGKWVVSKIAILGRPSFPHYLMKRIGHNYHLRNCFRI
ncbi:hypothetical protein LXL04_016838 [Taraxacum kok-saghyz]